MEYIERELERKFIEMDSFFKAVLVIGARQVGKSTMLKHLARKQNRTYVTMDDDFARELANDDPILFFQTYKPPILIDEIQKAPNLLERIKIIAADGPSDYMRRELNAMDEETFELFVKYQLANAERIELLGASSHTVDVLKNTK